MRYYDPMFYICSSDMPFGIRIEATLKYKTEKSALQYAVNTAIKRYPYFSVKIEGRAKTDYYVAVTTCAYRGALENLP